MKRFRFTVLGREVFCLEVEQDDVVEIDDEDLAITKDDVEKMVDQIDSDRKKIGGGQTIETDRDLNPLIPGLEKDYDSWADRPFGFSRPPKK